MSFDRPENGWACTVPIKKIVKFRTCAKFAHFWASINGETKNTVLTSVNGPIDEVSGVRRIFSREVFYNLFQALMAHQPLKSC